jgi:DNA-binding NarL/FixJ family response regulator
LYKCLLPGVNSVVIAAMSAPRLLLIDDHAMFRSGLAVLLRMSIGGLEVVEAGSMAEALQSTSTAPNAVLLDIVLKGSSGLDGIEHLQKRWPEVPIIMVSSDAAPQTVQLALARGASAFVSKEKPAEHILEVVRQALKLPCNEASSQDVAKPEPLESSGLTPRQMEVLDLLCQGLPNKAIGRKLELSENTIRWHVQGILAMLQVSNRSEAAFAARKQGLIS